MNQRDEVVISGLALDDGSYSLSLPSFIDPELLDPFQTYPPTTESDIAVNSLLKHYFSTCVFNMFPFYPAPGKNPQTEYYAPIIYSDAVLFHVTLQLSAVHLEKSQNQSGLRSRRLMTECIRLLRERVENGSDSGDAVSDQTISAVAGLAAIEVTKLLTRGLLEYCLTCGVARKGKL